MFDVDLLRLENALLYKSPDGGVSGKTGRRVNCCPDGSVGDRPNYNRSFPCVF